MNGQKAGSNSKALYLQFMPKTYPGKDFSTILKFLQYSSKWIVDNVIKIYQENSPNEPNDCLFQVELNKVRKGTVTEKDISDDFIKLVFNPKSMVTILDDQEMRCNEINGI